MFNMADRHVKIYTVAEINALIKSVLAAGLPGRLSITGQISGWKVYPSGHGYFTLKDESGVMPCVMWRSNVSKLKFEPQNGDAVTTTGYIDVYEQSGRYQFYVERMETSGVGNLQIAFEKLVKKLSGEGLFDDEHKKPLPKYPMRIGIVTSESGAAVHDIADSVYNRWPCAKMYLYPVLVQGEYAAAEIAAAIDAINKANKKLKLDILIVGRGGGSIEDLRAFNEEPVARAIFASDIPIISAVGHEVDTTIADLVADKRASTPTKAGVVAVPDMTELLERLEQTQRRLSSDIVRRRQLCTERLNTITASAVFRNPMSIIGDAMLRIDELARNAEEAAREIIDGFKTQLEQKYARIRKIEPHRLIGNKRLQLAELNSRAKAATVNIVAKNRLKFTSAKNRLKSFSPDRLVERKSGELEQLKKQTNKSITNLLSKHTENTESMENRLKGLNPKSILNRGYSITFNGKTNKVVSKREDIQIDDVIITEIANNTKITSKVTNTMQ